MSSRSKKNAHKKRGREREPYIEEPYMYTEQPYTGEVRYPPNPPPVRPELHYQPALGGYHYPVRDSAVRYARPTDTFVRGILQEPRPPRRRESRPGAERLHAQWGSNRLRIIDSEDAMFRLLDHEFESESPVIWTLGLFAMFACEEPRPHNKPLSIMLLWPRSSLLLSTKPLGKLPPPLGVPERELLREDEFRAIRRKLSHDYPLPVVEYQNARLHLQNPNNAPYDRWILNWLLERGLAVPCFDLAVTHLLHRLSTSDRQLQEQEQLPSLCIALLYKRQDIPISQGQTDLDFIRLMYRSFWTKYTAWLKGAPLDTAEFQRCRELRRQIDSVLSPYPDLHKKKDPGHPFAEYVEFLHDKQCELDQHENELRSGLERAKA